MLYLKSFDLPDESMEAAYVLSFPPKLEMSCYADSAYPFKIFPYKQLSHLEFAPITIFYGTNGSGKSTLLRILAAKTGLHRRTDAGDSPCLEDYLPLCRYETEEDRVLPANSRMIASEDVFDFLLDMQSTNAGLDARREELFQTYEQLRHEADTKPPFQLSSLADYESLKHRMEIRRSSKNQYVERRLPRHLPGKSNGESAYLYFTQTITENALFLLDEPENSLSAALQMELATFLEEAVRFYRCQLVIATHSPFLLAMRESRIYDLDAIPARIRSWTELPAVRLYQDFFHRHAKEFES